MSGVYTASINSSEGTETFSFLVDGRTENISYFYFDMDNCTAYTNVILNFTILDEVSGLLLNDSSLSIWFNITSSYLIGGKEFNLSYDTGNYYLVCIPNYTITNWTANAQADYSKAGYDEKNYYLVDYLLNNASTTKINLYLNNGTTQTKLQVRDYNDDPISDVYIKVLSYDLGTNSYITTEIVKTDTDGDAYAQIVQNTNWYAFILEYDGEIILQTLPTKITTTTLTFRINLDTDYFASYDVTQGITHSLTYNNDTTSFSFVWSDPTNNVQQGCLRLTRRSINGDTVINTSCVTSSAADVLLNITGALGTNTYIADSYVLIAGQQFQMDSLSISFNDTYRTFGASGLFFSMLLIIVLVMVGLWHPVAAILLMIIGVVVTNIIGLFYLNWTYIVTFIILAVITIYRTGKSD